MRQQLISYFFFLAAVLSILDGAFTLTPDMHLAKYVLLLFSGLIVALLVTTKKQQLLQATIAASVGGIALTQIMGSFPDVPFMVMIYDFLIFLAAVGITLGIEQATSLLTSGLEGAGRTRKKQPTFQQLWDRIILLAVALTFIILLIDLFTISRELVIVMIVVDGVITALFIIDLYFLYQQSKGWKHFLKHNFFDIIASIPSIGALRALKIIRAVRIIKATKGLTKLHRTTKFFSFSKK